MTLDECLTIPPRTEAGLDVSIVAQINRHGPPWAAVPLQNFHSYRPGIQMGSPVSACLYCRSRQKEFESTHTSPARAGGPVTQPVQPDQAKDQSRVGGGWRFGLIQAEECPGRGPLAGPATTVPGGKGMLPVRAMAHALDSPGRKLSPEHCQEFPLEP